MHIAMSLVYVKQRGSTLVVALIMLMLLTLIAISAMNATTTSIQVVGNAQYREEADAAAQQAIEPIISSSSFTVNPASSVASESIGGTNYTVAVATPTCTKSIPLTDAQILAASSVLGTSCLSSSVAPQTGTVSASGVVQTSSLSYCAQENWDVAATATDSNTGATTIVHQGVAIVVDPKKSICP